MNAADEEVMVRAQLAAVLAVRDTSSPLPLRCFGCWWPLYCYFSPDGTPNQATWWGWGKRHYS